MKKKILITGGAGLIGSILILYSSCGTSHKSCDGKKKFKTQMNY